MRVLCCNVRTSSANDGGHHWIFRKDLCLEVIRGQEAGLVCCQEVTFEQQSDLQAGLPEYAWFGMVDEPQGGGPVNSIFYRRDSFRLVSAGGYWLSQAPHIPGSSSWDSRCVRLCNWLRLVELSSGREFRLANTHLDHISQEARENQIGLVLADAGAYPRAYPQVLTGDLNCVAGNPAIQAILTAGWQDSYQAVHGSLNPGNTFHGFKGEQTDYNEGKIDWIFLRGALRATGAAILTAHAGERYPSDHYFISADLEINQP